MVLTASFRYTSRYFGNRTVKVDSSAKVPPMLSSRLKAGISHLLMSSVSHLQMMRQQIRTGCYKKTTGHFVRFVFLVFCRHLDQDAQWECVGGGWIVNLQAADN